MTSSLRFAPLLLLFLLGAPHVGLGQNAAWTLERAIAHAQDNNLQVRQGKLGLAGNDIDVDEARAAFLPNLNGSASHGYNWGQTIDPFTNQFATSRIRSNSLGIGSGITLFGGLANHLRLDQAEERRVAAEFDLQSTQNDVSLQVASAFLSLMFAEDALEIAALNVRTTETQVTRIRAFVDAGAAPEADLLDLQAQLASDQSAEVSAQGDVALARLQLAQSMRLSPEDAENLRIDRPDLSSIGNVPALPALNRVLDAALTSFPEIKAGESRIRQQEIGMDLAKTVGLPRLELRIRFFRRRPGARRRSHARDLHHWRHGDQPRAGPVECPDLQRVPDAPLQRPDFLQRQPKPLLQPVGAHLQRMVRPQRGAQSVERAHRDARNATETLAAAERSEASAKLAFDNAALRFEQGASTQVDYTQARNRYDSARLTALRSKYDLIFRIAILDFYSGRGLRFNL